MQFCVRFLHYVFAVVSVHFASSIFFKYAFPNTQHQKKDRVYHCNLTIVVFGCFMMARQPDMTTLNNFCTKRKFEGRKLCIVFFVAKLNHKRH